MQTKHILILAVCLIINCVNTQDCFAYGKRCNEHGLCCGGCCFEGVCMDTARPCYDLRSPCIDHYCPASMDCTIFQPEDCPGCELQAICV